MFGPLDRAASTRSPPTSCGRCCASRPTPWRWPASGPSPACRHRCWLGAGPARRPGHCSAGSPHTPSGLSTPMSSAIGVALSTAAHAYGWPVAEGGSSAISARDGRGCSRSSAARSRPACGSTPSTSSTRPTSSCSTSHPRAAVRIVGDAHAAAASPCARPVPPRAGRVQGRLRGRGRSAVAARAVAPCRHRARRRRLRGDRARRARGGARSDAGPAVRAGLPAVPRRPVPVGGRRPPALRLRPRPGRLQPATPPRRSRSRSSASLPGSASASSPGTSARPRRWRRTTPTTSAVTS